MTNQHPVRIRRTSCGTRVEVELTHGYPVGLRLNVYEKTIFTVDNNLDVGQLMTLIEKAYTRRTWFT